MSCVITYIVVAAWCVNIADILIKRAAKEREIMCALCNFFSCDVPSSLLIMYSKGAFLCATRPL